MKKLFFKADCMPSFTEKKQNGTVRLHFRRRIKAESYDLIIVNAEDLLVQLNSEQTEDQTKQTLSINTEGLKLISKLIQTNQVALILNVVGDRDTSFVKEYLIDHLKLQVDALYAHDAYPSDCLLDVSQIISDFRLLTDYHKRKFGMSSRFGHFKYLQIHPILQDILQKLYFNQQLAHSYTHVLISHLDSHSIPQTLLEVLCPNSEPA